MSINPIPRWLVVQYDRAKTNGWITSFRDAAGKYNHKIEDVMAIASRESNMDNIKGDFRDGSYHGYSLMQLDIGSHKKFIQSGEWLNAGKAIMKGAEALAEKRDLIIKASQQKSCVIKFRSGQSVKFTPKPFTDEELRRMTLAAYNCGLASYYHFSCGRDIDSGTTGKNYSRDVLERSKDFADILARDAIGKQANDRVIEQHDTPDALVTPRPGEQNLWNFDTIKSKYEAHADLLQKPSIKAVGVRAGVKVVGGLTTIWGAGLHGKIAITLTTILIGGVASWVIYKYRVQIKDFYTQLVAWVKKGVA
jgi:hypothetical protein